MHGQQNINKKKSKNICFPVVILVNLRNSKNTK